MRGGDRAAGPFVVPYTSSVPDLATMTRGALNVLDDDPDGLFLMVEGGAVDHAAHVGQSGRLIEEELAFDDAVDAVVAWVEARSSWSETLVIVTGDHETGYRWGPDRTRAGRRSSTTAPATCRACSSASAGTPTR